MEPAIVYRTFNPADAQLIRSRLEAAGIPADVIHEAAALSIEGYAMTAGGVRVWVPGERAEEATALIAQLGDSAPPSCASA
jgi:hypothetical protein